MTEIIWIGKDDRLGFHSARLPAPAVWRDRVDEGLLESLLNRPLQLSNYANPSHLDPAANCAHGIVKNHPFLDGNKRSGLKAAALFLELNCWIFEAPEEQAVLYTLALAAGETGADAFAAWLERSCSKR